LTLGVWVANKKRQLGFATQVSVIKVKVTVAEKIEIPFLLNNLNLFLPFDAKLGVWVSYKKRQLEIAIQVFVIKVKVTVAKNRNYVSAQ
jgi:tetrahydromethanopterin S-methyltransferase subunit C